MKLVVNLNQPKIERIERVGFGYKPIPEVYEYTESLSELKEFSESHKRRKEIVRQVLDGWIPARNSDVLMYWECLRTEFPDIQLTSSNENIIFKIPKRLIKFLPSSESYRRPRQQFNAKGLLLPTDPLVIEKRRAREKAIRTYFRGEKSGEES